jgi:hypothetical protein
MSNVKFVIVQESWRGRWTAMRGLAFETREAAQAHLDKTIRKSCQHKYAIETRALKADDTNARMHCQCCGRSILAKGGLIAHHGYERPGTGWQTSSCPGARKDPWEVSRSALGRMIEGLRNSIDAMRKARAAVEAEQQPVTFSYIEYGKAGARTSKTLTFTRDTFDAEIRNSTYRMGYYGDDATFDGFKKRDLRDRAGRLRMQVEFLAECEVRYAGWKQTHKRDGELWVRI